MINAKNDCALAGKLILNKGMQTMSCKALTTDQMRFIEVYLFSKEEEIYLRKEV
jgi:hypothetical protein